MNKHKLYFDAEFTGLYQNTKLISIGIVSSFGTYFYAEFNDYNNDNDDISDWIKENVINNLLYQSDCINIDSIPTRVTRYDNNHTVFNMVNITMRGNTNEIREQLLKWLFNEYYISNRQLQFYTDCYAYDWVLLNNLICQDGNALNIPNYIYYIPLDLSTALQLNNIDPDINREKFCNINYDEYKTIIFPKFNNISKHNSLWDAYICKASFNKLLNK